MKAFTIIEVMISVAIFSVIMTVALGALLAISQSDSRAEALKSVTDELNFALDDISRTARTGDDYDCGAALSSTGVGLTPAQTPCTGPAESSIAFLAQDGQTVYGYCLGAGGVCMSPSITSCPAAQTCSILRYSYNPTGGASVLLPVTSSQVSISSLSFYVFGKESSIQPKITILLSGSAASTGQNATFNIESSVTQRVYDQ